MKKLNLDNVIASLQEASGLSPKEFAEKIKSPEWFVKELENRRDEISLNLFLDLIHDCGAALYVVFEDKLEKELEEATSLLKKLPGAIGAVGLIDKDNIQIVLFINNHDDIDYDKIIEIENRFQNVSIGPWATQGRDIEKQYEFFSGSKKLF